MKSDRLIALLLALQNGGKQSAPELARTLEVSPRTIYRDVDALSAAGIPVSAERGVRGGIVLADSYRDALARFDENELRALFVSSDDVLADVGLVGRRSSALGKLARSLPRRARAALERDRGRVHVDARGWYRVSVPPASLAALRDAVWGDLRVTIAYRDRSGASTRRTVDPLGLVAKAGVWYLVARDRDVIKTFRVQRVGRVRILGQRFERPRDFDIGEYWRSVAVNVRSHAAQYVATFEMSDRALANAKVYLNVESHARIARSSPRRSIVRIVFPSCEAAVHEAFGWDADTVAVAPTELRQLLVERARALLDSYGAGTRAKA